SDKPRHVGGGCNCQHALDLGVIRQFSLDRALDAHYSKGRPTDEVFFFALANGRHALLETVLQALSERERPRFVDRGLAYLLDQQSNDMDRSDCFKTLLNQLDEETLFDTVMQARGSFKLHLKEIPADQLVNLSQVAEFPEEVPVLIKRGANYWFYGMNDGVRWGLTPLNTRFMQSQQIDFSKKSLSSFETGVIAQYILAMRAHRLHNEEKRPQRSTFLSMALRRESYFFPIIERLTKEHKKIAMQTSVTIDRTAGYHSPRTQFICHSSQYRSPSLFDFAIEHSKVLKQLLELFTAPNRYKLVLIADGNDVSPDEDTLYVAIDSGCLHYVLRDHDGIRQSGKIKLNLLGCDLKTLTDPAQIEPYLGKILRVTAELAQASRVPPFNRFITQDSHQLIMSLIRHPDSLQLILTYFHENEGSIPGSPGTCELIFKNNHALLRECAKQKQVRSLELVLSWYNLAKLPDHLTKPGVNGDHLVHYIARSPECFERLVKLVDTSVMEDLITAKGFKSIYTEQLESSVLADHGRQLRWERKNDDTALSIMHPSCFAVMLERYPSDQRLRIMNNFLLGYELLHIAASEASYEQFASQGRFLDFMGYQSVSALLALLPSDEERLQAVLSPSQRDGRTPLFYALSSSSTFFKMMSYLTSDSAILDALLMKDRWGKNILHYVMKNDQYKRVFYDCMSGLHARRDMAVVYQALVKLIEKGHGSVGRVQVVLELQRWMGVHLPENPRGHDIQEALSQLALKYQLEPRTIQILVQLYAAEQDISLDDTPSLSTELVGLVMGR
ncbi:MAG: hypothetical protein ACOYKA_06480, partial [Legionellaceae bacterium]